MGKRAPFAVESVDHRAIGQIIQHLGDNRVGLSKVGEDSLQRLIVDPAAGEVDLKGGQAQTRVFNVLIILAHDSVLFKKVENQRAGIQAAYAHGGEQGKDQKDSGEWQAIPGHEGDEGIRNGDGTTGSRLKKRASRTAGLIRDKALATVPQIPSC